MKRYRDRLKVENSLDEDRMARMNRINPKYVLRNHIAQRAIEQANEQQDYSEIDRLLTLLKDPYTDRPDMEEYAIPAPSSTPPIIVSCSS